MHVACSVVFVATLMTFLVFTISLVVGSRGIDKLRLGAVGADGASVTGVMTAEQLEVTPFGNLSASNVCKELAKEVGASVLCHHCCAHKVQLAAGDSWNKILYLKQLEKRIRSLHKHLKHSGKAVNALIFWSAASGGGPVSELHFARSRWISQLFPMRIISRNYVTFLSYLLGQHESLTGSEKDKETKGVISLIFSFLASWMCRVLVAGCVDLPGILSKYKNKFEPADLHPDTVSCAIVDLKRAVRDYLGKSRVVAQAIANAKADGPTA